MTVTTVQLAEAAVTARQGADLFRFNLGDRIPETAFARNDDGSILVTGVDFLKTGVFKGLQLLDEDLDAIVARFDLLLGAGIFQPPFRLDHSWSVLSVIGYVQTMSTYRRVDETDGVEKAFLRGDVLLTGSVDYTPATLVDAIKRGALRNRSSEIGFYETNAGTEYPLVFYGCAYVDIPAVEGLAPVELSRTRLSVPHSINDLTPDPEGTPTMDPKKLGRLKALRKLTRLSADQSVELGELNAAATAAKVTDEQVEAAEADATVVEPPAETPTETDEQRAGREAAEAAAAGTGTETGDASAAELAVVRAELVALRTERTTELLTTLRSAGVVNDGNVATATTLLNHDDPEVRRCAGALLSSMRPPVELSRRVGRTALSAAAPATGGGSTTGTTDLGAPVIELGMTPEEMGAAWTQLTPAERKLRQPELDAWTADRGQG